ncbi:hypothetical protein HZS_5198 [Henneguya salminicola]|nr:hypothetical protein HZS_5198 [Henneguya salminicola]
MLSPFKNLKSYFYSKESTILYLIGKEAVQQPFECLNFPNSRISRRKRRWRCAKKNGPKCLYLKIMKNIYDLISAYFAIMYKLSMNGHLLFLF